MLVSFVTGTLSLHLNEKTSSRHAVKKGPIWPNVCFSLFKVIRSKMQPNSNKIPNSNAHWGKNSSLVIFLNNNKGNIHIFWREGMAHCHVGILFWRPLLATLVRWPPSTLYTNYLGFIINAIIKSDMQQIQHGQGQEQKRW